MKEWEHRYEKENLYKERDSLHTELTSLKQSLFDLLRERQIPIPAKGTDHDRIILALGTEIDAHRHRGYLLSMRLLQSKLELNDYETIAKNYYINLYMKGIYKP